MFQDAPLFRAETVSSAYLRMLCSQQEESSNSLAHVHENQIVCSGGELREREFSLSFQLAVWPANCRLEGWAGALECRSVDGNPSKTMPNALDHAFSTGASLAGLYLVLHAPSAWFFLHHLEFDPYLSMGLLFSVFAMYLAPHLVLPVCSFRSARPVRGVRRAWARAGVPPTEEAWVTPIQLATQQKR